MLIADFREFSCYQNHSNAIMKLGFYI